MISDVEARINELLSGLGDAQRSTDIDLVGEELLSLLNGPHGDLTLRLLHDRSDRLHHELDNAKLKVASVMSRMAMATLCVAEQVEIPYVERTACPAASGPAGESLLAALILLEQAHETVPIDEASVVRSLDPLNTPDFGNYGDVFAGAVTLLKTGSYYVLDARDAACALASDPPEQDTFPPLPFPRIWIENRHPSMNKTTPYLRFQDSASDRLEKFRVLDVLGVGLAEIERGHVWDVYVAFQFSGDLSFFMAERIAPDQVLQGDPEMSDLASVAFEAIRRLAVGGAHLLTAKNVPHEGILLPRHQRKRLVPALGKWLPRMYYVNLAASGEHDDHQSGREYHVRWLVRGHWRHMDGGNALCSCCLPPRVATWIEPYIKGPVGAPWKGRPVHRSVART